MRRGTLILAVLTIALALSGCAVLTVDVDVYKGTLANHESVQNEQVAAIAMGAKPLLAELRYKLEDAECKKQAEGESQGTNASDARSDRVKCPRSAQDAAKTANFIPLGNLQSRDAQRVNEILSLYEDATGQVLRPLGEAASRLINRIEDASRLVRGRINREDKDKRPEVAAELARLTRVKRLQPSFEVPKGEENLIAAVKSAWEAADDTWQEAIRVLSSDDMRTRLKEFGNDAIWDVAWVAADLTSGEGLRRFLTDEDPTDKSKPPTRRTPDTVKTGAISNLTKWLQVLTKKDKPLNRTDENAVGAILAQELVDKERGPALAKHLAMAQGYAATNPAPEWFITLYPTKDLLLDIDKDSLDDLRWISNLHAVESALGAGRPIKGLEKLIDEYLKEDRFPTDAKLKRTLEQKKRDLHNGLVNFAEKVTIIANFDPLLRDRYEDTRKYVRVLQAVGNSILSQVDALRQSEAHRGQITNARETEVEGIRNAEARAAAVLKQISAELKKQPPNFPDKTVIHNKLDEGGEALDEIVGQIDETSDTQRGFLEKEQKNAAKWAAAAAVLEQKEVRDAVEQYGKATAPRTMADVAREIIRVLEKKETEARRSGGAGDDVASEFQMAIAALNDQKFTGDTANPGPAEDKYRRILLEIGRARVAAGDDAAAAKWERIGIVLDQQEFRDAVEQFGKTTMSRTTADVAREIVRVLEKLENDTGRPGGTGVKEARRIETAADALRDSRFTGDTANPGTVVEKYRLIQNLVIRERDATRTVEADREAIVAALDRWNRQVTLMRSEARARLGIPDRVEKGKVSDDGQKPTAQDVLDVMVATLRYEHVNAMKTHGPDNPITKNLAAAVELNFAYRSGMVHIRPASTFLRNSYPATILQQDPTAGFWRNMLTEHAAHQLPFYEFFYNNKYEEEVKINKAIDKQFWQSVNQVRVSGVGRTNYAIAKDDVGNWYVKSYSSNPMDIIQSAKNLAMFSAGSAMGANFLAKGAQPGGADVPTTKEARSTLAKQFDRSTERYTDATKETRDKLKTEVDGLEKRLKSAVAKSGVSDGDFKKMDDAKAFAPPTGPSFDNLAKDRDSKNNLKGASALNKDIAAALLALKQYRNDVTTRLDRIPMAKEGTNPDATKGEVAFGALAKSQGGCQRCGEGHPRPIRQGSPDCNCAV